jgi:hypothetical protein
VRPGETQHASRSRAFVVNQWTSPAGGLDNLDLNRGDGLAVGVGLVEGEAFQMCPGDHAEVLGPAASQIVDVADEFGDEQRDVMAGPPAPR